MQCHHDHSRAAGIDNSAVTPATGTNACNKPLIAKSLVNEMPTADSPAVDGSHRADPDKIIPGPEAASGVDGAEEAHTAKRGGKG